MNATLNPNDEYNQQLENNVHPPDWINPTPAARYNLVVIGAGTAGLVTASIAAALGARVALIEKHLMGGDCLNVGCVPSKAIIRSSRAAAQFRAAERFGIATVSIEPNFESVMTRMRRIRSEISLHDSARRFSALGVDVYLGNASFASPDSMSVAGTTLRFRSAVIATGARAAVPPIPGLAEAGFLTNETLFALTRRPERFVIIGGGPIGCEMAQAFARLGSKVTLIEAGPQFLPREDPDAADILRKSLERDGVAIHLGVQIAGVTMHEGAKQLQLKMNTGELIVSADEILVGTGRVPNVEGLNLETASVAYDTRMGIKVSDALQTSNPRIFAAGDVCSAYKFTHSADFAARIVAQNALFPFLPKKKFSSLVIPWCTYTDPEVAHVGAYGKELAERGVPHETVVQPLDQVDRAILDGETEGFVKIHITPKSGKILGATIVATHAGDLISQLTQAMVSGLPLTAISSVIHPYPTQAEAIRKAADQFNRKRLTPGRQKLLKWILERLR